MYTQQEWEEVTIHLEQYVKVKMNTASGYGSITVCQPFLRSSNLRCFELNRDFPESDWHKDGEWNLYYETEGSSFQDSMDVAGIEMYFEDPLHPTPEECILFELEKGIPYIIGELVHGTI